MQNNLDLDQHNIINAGTISGKSLILSSDNHVIRTDSSVGINTGFINVGTIHTHKCSLHTIGDIVMGDDDNLILCTANGWRPIVPFGHFEFLRDLYNREYMCIRNGINLKIVFYTKRGDYFAEDINRKTHFSDKRKFYLMKNNGSLDTLYITPNSIFNFFDNSIACIFADDNMKIYDPNNDINS